MKNTEPMQITKEVDCDYEDYILDKVVKETKEL